MELKKGLVTYAWGAKSNPPTGLPFNDVSASPRLLCTPFLPSPQVTLLTVRGRTRAQQPLDWTAWVQFNSVSY